MFSVLYTEISLDTTVNILIKTDGLHCLDIMERIFTKVKQSCYRPGGAQRVP